jgi:uncharacterized protein (DUF58 family)
VFKLRSRLTQEGWYFVVVLALVLVRASMKDINLMLAFAGMMTGALYFNWLVLRMTLRKLAIRRRLPESVAAGDAAVIAFEATSSHRATAVIVDDSFQLAGSRRREDRGNASAIFPQISRGQPARAEYRVRFGRRGRYEFGPIHATSRHPLRLVSRTISFAAHDKFVVLPRLGRLTNRWTQVRRGPEPGPRRVLQRHGLTEGDFYGMRDWRAGDSRRWIHWRTSARRGKLMVRQFEQPRSENLTLLLELWQPEKPSPTDEDTIELAVSFAATIAADVCRRGGCQLQVGIAGSEVIALGGGASRALARDVLERLALAEASRREQLGDLVRRGLENGLSSGRIVLISTRPSSSDESNRITAAAATPQERSALGQMLRIDASGDELLEYFRIDDPRGHG